MNEFLKQDVFFFVTTIAVVIFTVLMAVVIIYTIKIFKDIKYISGRAREEVDLISEDLSELRENVREKGAKLKYFASFFGNLMKRSKDTKK